MDVEFDWKTHLRLLHGTWREELLDAMRGGPLQGWQFVATIGTTISLSKNTLDGAGICMRATAVVKIPASRLVPMLADVANMPRYDPGCIDGRVIEQVPRGSALVGHIRLRSASTLPLFSSPYDFVFLQEVVPVPDEEGGMLVIRHSIEHHRVPEMPRFATRGRMRTCGFVVLPHEAQEDSTEVICMQCMDLDWTPDVVISQLVERQCLVVASLQTLAKGALTAREAAVAARGGTDDGMTASVDNKMVEEWLEGLIYSALAKATDGWQFVKEEEGVLVEKKLGDDNSEGITLRGRTYISAPALTVFKLLSSITSRGTTRTQHDSLLSDGQTIREVYSDGLSNISIQHACLELSSPIFSNRDFVFIQVSQPVGSIYVVMAHSVIDEGMKERQDYVRGEILTSGFIIQGPEDGGPECCVTYVSSLDLKGWCPSWISDSILADIPMRLAKLQKMMWQQQLVLGHVALEDEEDEEFDEEDEEEEEAVENPAIEVPEMRWAPDGRQYTYREYVEYFGGKSAKDNWNYSEMVKPEDMPELSPGSPTSDGSTNSQSKAATRKKMSSPRRKMANLKQRLRDPEATSSLMASPRLSEGMGLGTPRSTLQHQRPQVPKLSLDKVVVKAPRRRK